MFPLNSVDDLERLVTEKIDHPVHLHVLSSIEAVATTHGYESYGAFSRRILEKLEPKLKSDMKNFIEQSNL